MKTGLFFGSYNPIHIGHLAIANYILEYTDLDRLWFVISPHNPLKEKKSLLANHHRYALVNIAIEDHPGFKASDIEFRLPQPSYTIDTLTYLKEKYPQNNFVLIMGSDNIETLDKWKNPQQILNNYRIFVYPRPGMNPQKIRKHKNISIVDAPLIEISSSFIRNAIKERKNIRYYLPKGVYEYIIEMHFYEK